jgi:hypothetical protein
MIRSALLLPTLLLAGACTAARPAPPADTPPVEPSPPTELPPAAPAPAPAPPAPWSAPPLAASEVPGVYAAQWRQAENRATCAPIAPASLGEQATARPRAATFGGGWGVAYDLPELRSAFGVAGAGVSASGATYAGWPHRLEWADGSTAEYGPEGGTGPKQLAYLRIAGQDCLYNVWSGLGRAHLERLLGQLRFVRVEG